MRRITRRQQPGQSAVLLAFMLLVLVAMVGLSVDVGNAYGQQRRVQMMSNAGAMAAMASATANNTNNDIWTDVQRTLMGNRVKTNSMYTYTVDYIMDDGTVETLGEWNGSTAFIPNGNSYPPANLSRVQVTMGELVKTRFAGVVGRHTLGVSATGVACLGDYGYGIFPLGAPQVLRRPQLDPATGAQISSGHHIYYQNGQELPFDSPDWGNWSKLRGMIIRIPFSESSSDFAPGTHMSWLNWGGSTQTVDGKQYTQISGLTGSDALRKAFTNPGTLQDAFLEAASPDSALPNVKPIGTLQRGDWISGDTGVIAAMDAPLSVLIQKQTDVMLPMYDAMGGNGSSAAFHMVNMGRFKIRGVQLQTGTKYIDLMYTGDAKASPAECGSEASAQSSMGRNKQFNIKGEVKLANRVWRAVQSAGTTTYDIVIVMDTSDSMAFDWYDRQPGQVGYVSSNARINDAKRIIKDFVQKYDISPATGDPDARIAFVTFGGDTSQGAPAVLQAGFQTACAPELIATNCGDVTKKWSPIQSTAAGMSLKGITPGPIAFEIVESLLQNKRTPPAGKKYQQIVLFATDGVFNVCGKDIGERNCPYGKEVPGDGSSTNKGDYTNNPDYNAVSGRPIWQAQQVANRIRNSGANIFMITLVPTCLANDSSCFKPAYLADMSSGAGYYYQANDSTALTQIFSKIRQTIVTGTCIPREMTQQATNATVLLTKPDNPTWTKQALSDSSGIFLFSNLAAGQYIVKVEPALAVKSYEDGLTRTYSRMRNGRSLSEEGQASVYINPLFPNNANVAAQLLVSLPLASDGSPNNGCTMPAP